MLLEPSTLLAFGLTAAIIVISPGPDTAMIIRHSLAAGRLGGLAAVTGVQLGLLVHTMLAGLGISALIAASPTLFKSLALAGVLYLAWLGVGLLMTHSGCRPQCRQHSRVARRPRGHAHQSAQSEGTDAVPCLVSKLH